MKSIKVISPSSVANLSCGFDILGICLDHTGDEMIFRESKIPGLRIDYIMHDKSFKSFNYHKKDDILSDHYAISCEIKI